MNYRVLCYDCRTTGQRLDDLTERVVELERVNVPSVARADWMAEVERQLMIQRLETNTRHRQMIDVLAERLAALETSFNRLVHFAGSDQEVKDLSNRLAALEAMRDELHAAGVIGPDAWPQDGA